MQLLEAKRLLEVIRAEKDADLTLRANGWWSLGSEGTLVLDNKQFSSYNEIIDYLENVIKEQSGGFGDGFH